MLLYVADADAAASVRFCLMLLLPWPFLGWQRSIVYLPRPSAHVRKQLQDGISHEKTRP